jgi:hypothetical protein
MEQNMDHGYYGNTEQAVDSIMVPTPKKPQFLNLLGQRIEEIEKHIIDIGLQAKDIADRVFGNENQINQNINTGVPQPSIQSHEQKLLGSLINLESALGRLRQQINRLNLL